MRIGQNPEKEGGKVRNPKRARLVVPVYIPDESGYFGEASKVLRLCLESLHLTSAKSLSVSVVSNGCAAEVVTHLERMFSLGWIDQLVLSRWNLGKTGAIASVLKGAAEPLVA